MLVSLYLLAYINSFSSTLFNTASSATHQIPLEDVGIEPMHAGLLRLWHCQSEAVAIRLDLIHSSAIDLLHTRPLG
jgi:hypothetical protein